ncbi:twitching motility protein PilT [Peptococcaceae bacterium SCADC1_2_3]|jgi:PIN domain nuclease of toxin-antitoxin system|nr:twitching motility protein PilT [Peptococcaceae bacterium SCADC1_2_3]KFI36338.1 twitching motility protein PilT [Peptococcaceae bacterium SCADC1_2_3]KFI36613.1 twitching motility protein PilT [Peptococcaceae bacterium SCADC1_2_3]KFI37662.1 twitching motility protein PilT [Peptococcaceae bacterium SCADC1_2_3]
MSKRWVLDASALLALLNDEPGGDLVAEAIKQMAVISAVNLSEVVAKLHDAGIPTHEIHEILEPLGIEIIDFNLELAYRTGMLRLATKKAGLSLGDRACLALAEQLGMPLLTADRSWKELRLSVDIHLIR